MNRFRNDRRGQFVILVAVIIAAFMFSLILSISQISTRRQEVSYEPIDETVLAITSDFERCLTRALAIATQNYSETWDASKAEASGVKFIDGWRKTILESYNGFGVNITLSVENIEGKNIGWEINWGKKDGVSAVYTTFDMNIEAYGLRKLAVTMRKAVHLNILDAKMELNDTDSIMTVVFQAYFSGERKYFRPISDLTQDSLELLINGTKNESYEVVGFEYLGQGICRVQFDLDGLIVGSITLVVTESSGIKVGATQKLCILTLLSDDIETENTDNEGSFTINDEKTCEPPYTLSLFPSQTLTVTFEPPSGDIFIGFKPSGLGETIDVEQNGSSITVNIVGGGFASITAQYGVTEEIECYITLRSEEDNGPNDNLGKFELTFNSEPEIYGDNETLPVTVWVPYNEELKIKYYEPRELGYVFKGWKIEGNITFYRSEGPSCIRVAAFGNGTITAVYEASRSEDWRVIYISPEKGGVGKEKEFMLELFPPPKDEEIRPQFNKKFDERSGNTTKTTPMLKLGDTVTITLYAKYTKKSGEAYIDVNVTLGFFVSNGTFFEIGSGTIRVLESSSHREYKITFSPPKVSVVPEGSILTLSFMRMDDKGTGTLHILCGPPPTGSRIELW
ncbi:MAG: hypothetical protein QXS05_07710 [Candidatus Bathyarchaeia archaeon]